MSGIGMLEVALGLAVVYLLLSLAVTSVVELLEALLRKRAADLETWVTELLVVQPTDPEPTRKLEDEFLAHPLVRSLAIKGARPSYIPPRVFALALLDVLGFNQAQRPLESLDEVVKKLPAHARGVVLPLLQAAQQDLEKARGNLEGWFNDAMERLTGRYKRYAQWVVTAVAVVLVAGLNADTLRIAKTLVREPVVRATLAATAEEYARSAAQFGFATQPPAAPAPAPSGGQPPMVAAPRPGLDVQPAGVPPQGGSASAPSAQASAVPPRAPLGQWVNGQLADVQLVGIPFGWSGEETKADALAWLQKVLGLLLTVFAVSLGAPFWFDVLNKIVTLRSTLKPADVRQQ